MAPDNGSIGQYSYRAQITVGTSSLLVLPAGTWQVIVLRNSSTAGQEITLNPGFGAAVDQEGIVLGQKQAWIESRDSAFVPYSGNIQAVANAAGAILSVYAR